MEIVLGLLTFIVVWVTAGICNVVMLSNTTTNIEINQTKVELISFCMFGGLLLFLFILYMALYGLVIELVRSK